MTLVIPRIKMKRLDDQMQEQVAWEVDNLVRDRAHLERFRQQIKVCNGMVTAYEEAFEERERRKKERCEALRAKYGKDIARIKRYGKYRGDKAPGQAYKWMAFIDNDNPEDNVGGWVKLQDASDLLDQDDVFPVSDLPPKPFPAPELIMTGQRTDSRSPEVDEYLPGYFWMLAALHDTTLKQRPQIITEREGLHEKLAFELAAHGVMLKAPPYTYEHVGCALDDVRADLEGIGAGTVTQPKAPNQEGNGGQGEQRVKEPTMPRQDEQNDGAKAARLRAVAAAVEKWGEAALADDGRGTEAHREAAREALRLSIEDLKLLKDSQDRFGLAGALREAFASIGSAASEYYRGEDLGGYWVWWENLTQKQLPGSVSFPDEVRRWAGAWTLIERGARPLNDTAAPAAGKPSLMAWILGGMTEEERACEGDEAWLAHGELSPDALRDCCEQWFMIVIEIGKRFDPLDPPEQVSGLRTVSDVLCVAATGRNLAQQAEAIRRFEMRGRGMEEAVVAVQVLKDKLKHEIGLRLAEGKKAAKAAKDAGKLAESSAEGGNDGEAKWPIMKPRTETAPEYIFRAGSKHGQQWTLRFEGGEPAHLGHLKGLRNIQHLLRHPRDPDSGRDKFSGFQLIAASEGLQAHGTTDSEDEFAKEIQETEYAPSVRSKGVHFNAKSDRKALNDARDSYQEATEEKERAIRNHDPAGVAAADSKMRDTVAYIVSSEGLGGQLRKWATNPQKASEAVRKRIKTALNTIDAAAKDHKDDSMRHLATHLHNSIQHGAGEFWYEPDRDIPWQF